MTKLIFPEYFFSKKDPEVMKKAIFHLSWPLSENSTAIVVQKKVINAISQLYPFILKWAVQKKTDKKVEESWQMFTMLKNRIMQTLDSDNEGYIEYFISYFF